MNMPNTMQMKATSLRVSKCSVAAAVAATGLTDVMVRACAMAWFSSDSRYRPSRVKPSAPISVGAAWLSSRV